MTAGLMALCYDSFSDLTRRGQGQEIPVYRERGRLLLTSETRPDKKMEKRMVVTLSSLATLAILAVDGQRKHLLFTMHGRCFGLRSAHTIAVRDTLSSVCSNSFGEVVYRQLGRGLESCRIRTIEAVSNKDDARGLVEDRKRAKREERSESG